MVRGKAFMLPPWSSVFDMLVQQPLGVTDPKEGHSRRRGKKKTPKEEQELYEVLCPACVYEH